MLKFLKSKPLSLILLGLIFLLIILHFIGLLLPVENLIISLLSPLQKKIYVAGGGLNNFYSGFYADKDVLAENKELSEQVKQLTIKNAELKSQISACQEMLKQHNYLETNKFEAVLAQVIGKNPEANMQSIIIDKGDQDGISLDQPVIADQGIIVGKISKVRKNSSEVILINDSRSRIAALIQNEDNSKGVVLGEHGLSLKMELIPQAEKIKVGDLAVTSGLEAGIPRGLVLGKISRIDSKPNELFVVAGIQPLIRLDNLFTVSVLLTKKYD